MNVLQAKTFQILLFKLHMDARWDNLPLKFKPSKFQLPPLTLGKGGGGGGGVH